MNRTPLKESFSMSAYLFENFNNSIPMVGKGGHTLTPLF